MASETKVGIVVEAKDKGASKVLRGVGVAAGTMGKAVKGVGAAGMFLKSAMGPLFLAMEIIENIADFLGKVSELFEHLANVIKDYLQPIVTKVLGNMALMLVDGIAWGAGKATEAFTTLGIAALRFKQWAGFGDQTKQIAEMEAQLKSFQSGILDVQKNLRKAIETDITNALNAPKRMTDAEKEALDKRVEFAKKAEEEREQAVADAIERAKLQSEAYFDNEKKLKETDVALKKSYEDKLSQFVEERNKYRSDVAENQYREQENAAREFLAVQISVAQSAANAFASAFEAMITGQENAATAMLKAIIESVKAAIMAYAALAAAKEMATAAGILPGFGILLGAAAAAAMLTAVQAFASKVPEPKKFARGGLVTGGIMGRDSVPALLTPGERVLTASQNRDYERRSAPSVNITMSVNTLAEPSDVDLTRVARKLGKKLADLQRLGMVNLQGA